MVRKFSLILLIAALSLGAAAQAPAPAAPALTLDQILAKNLQARGGLEKLKSAKTVRMTGRMLLGQGMEAPLTIEFKRPNMMRLDLTIQGMTITQAYDGKSGWSVMPLQGNKDPQPMGEDEVKAMAEQADMDGMLIDSQQKGYKLELMGKEPVEGGDAYKIKVTTKNGDQHMVYLDADSFLEIKGESKIMIRGNAVESENTLGDYKEVQGIMFPFAIDGGQKGSPQRQKMTIDKVEVNPVVDDARFKMPEVKKPEPATEKKPGM